LLWQNRVDRAVIASAAELFHGRHYPGVVAMCSDALDEEPECVPLLLIRARAQIALRRDLDAQADLRDIIRIDASCGTAFRLLGVLAARRNENESASVFFREALRLDPRDREAYDWLMIVDRPLEVPPARSAAPRLARGTQAPVERDEETAEDRPTQPFLRAPKPQARSRASTPELPGFGEYLVASGILSRERLRAAQAYQRSMKVQLSTAIVTLGLATPQRIEWAAVAHQSQLARDR
jgi:tetratricopeptide (TPR) repeat protein